MRHGISRRADAAASAPKAKPPDPIHHMVDSNQKSWGYVYTRPGGWMRSGKVAAKNDFPAVMFCLF